MADEVEKREEVEKQLEEAKPKVAVHDALVETAEDDLPVHAYASIISDKYGCGRNLLYAYLRDNAMLMKNNLPKQRWINQGVFKVKEVAYPFKDNGRERTKFEPMTFITPQGQAYIVKKLAGCINEVDYHEE